MAFSAPDSFVSGKPYRVVDVGHEPPASLDQFVGRSEFGVDRDGSVSRVQGEGAAVGDAVRFHEKDLDSSGKDVRVWTVREQGGGFTAELLGLH